MDSNETKNEFAPDLPSCTWTYTTVHGLIQVCLWSKNLICPIGTMWILPGGRSDYSDVTVEILDCYVVAFARRKGVMRKLHGVIFDMWEGKDAVARIVTQSFANDDAYQAGIRLGYVKSEDAGFWVLNRNHPVPQITIDDLPPRYPETLHPDVPDASLDFGREVKKQPRNEISMDLGGVNLPAEQLSILPDKCINCSEPGRCLCSSCLRALIVPVLIVESIRWILHLLH